MMMDNSDRVSEQRRYARTYSAQSADQAEQCAEIAAREVACCEVCTGIILSASSKAEEETGRQGRADGLICPWQYRRHQHRRNSTAHDHKATVHMVQQKAAEDPAGYRADTDKPGYFSRSGQSPCDFVFVISTGKAHDPEFQLILWSGNPLWLRSCGV